MRVIKRQFLSVIMTFEILRNLYEVKRKGCRRRSAPL